MVEARPVCVDILVFAFAGEKHAPIRQFFYQDLRMEPTEAYVGTAAEVLVGLLGTYQPGGRQGLARSSPQEGSRGGGSKEIG